MTVDEARERLERIVPDMSPDFWAMWEERINDLIAAAEARALPTVDALADAIAAHIERDPHDPRDGCGGWCAEPILAILAATPAPAPFAWGGHPFVAGWQGDPERCAWTDGRWSACKATRHAGCHTPAPAPEGE